MNRRKCLAIIVLTFFALAQAATLLDWSVGSVAAADSWGLKISADQTSGEAPLTVNFHAHVTHPPGEDYSVSWNFRDGSTSNENNPKHTFIAGSYIVAAELIASNGTVQSSDSITIEVSPSTSPPTVSISANPVSGIAPLDVSFTSSVSGGQSPYAYAWDFGDGQTSNQQNLVHQYGNPGQYSARLTVTDNSNQQATASAVITVEKKAAPPLQVSFSANQTAGVAPLSVSFSPSVSGGTPPYAYKWDFGTGDTSTDENPTYVFSSSGLHHVTLTVHDSGQGSSMAQAKYVVIISVQEAPPKALSATISGSSSKGGSPLSVQFASLVGGGSPGYFYEWSFGDGNTSNEVNPNHTFINPGQYYVHLNVTDSKSQVVSSNTLVITVEGSQVAAQGTPFGGNPGGALILLGTIGIVTIATVLTQFALNRRRKKTGGKQAD